MITSLFAGIIVLSLSLIGLVVLLRAGRTRPSLLEGRVSGTAWLCGLWLVSTVFFNTYFWALRPAGMFDISLDRLLFLLLLAMMAGRVYRGGFRPGRRPALDVLLLVFACLCLVSLSIHGFTVTRAGFGKPWNSFLSGYLLPFGAFFCVKYFCSGEADDACLMNWLLWMGVAIAVIAVMETVGLRDYVFPRYIADRTNPIHLDRARGPFLNAAFNGQALCIALVAGLTLLPLRRFPMVVLHGALLALLVLAAYFTRTRSVYLQLLIIAGAVVAVMRTSFPKWKVYALPAFLAFLLLLASLPRLTSPDRIGGGLGQMREVAIRFELVNKSLALWAAQPFFGVGLGQFRNVGLMPPEQVDHQHNHLIGMAAELGLVGVGVYVAILATILTRLFRLFGKLPEQRFYNANFLLLLGVVLLCDLASNTFVEPALVPFAQINVFVFAGMVDRLYERYA
jgi:O-antigen ligase